MSVAALVVCVLLQPNAAPPASERDAVRQLVARVIESHGGREALAKRKCYYWRGEGTLWNGARKCEVKKQVWSKGPARLRGETDHRPQDALPFSSVHVLTPSGMWCSMNGRTTELPKAARVSIDAFYYAGLLPLSDDSDLRITLLPDRKVSGSPAFGIRVSGLDRVPASLFFDRKTSLLTSMEAKVEVDGKTMLETLTCSDYKKFDGGLWPTKRVRVWGKWREEITMKKLELLDDVDDEKFDKP